MASRIRKLKSRGRPARKPRGEVVESEARRIRRTHRWRVLSERIRRSRPLCEDPYEVHLPRPVASEQVHHIITIEEDVALAFSPDNLIALCVACHSRAERQGMPAKYQRGAR